MVYVFRLRFAVGVAAPDEERLHAGPDAQGGVEASQVIKHLLFLVS